MKENKEIDYITEWQELQIFSIYYKCNFEQFALNQPITKKHRLERTIMKFQEICNLGIYSLTMCIYIIV